MTEVFPAQAHAHCAETFYKREVESEIRSKPSANLEERKRMLEMLRNFEQEDGTNSLEGLDENEADDDLTSRLADIDIGEQTIYLLCLAVCLTYIQTLFHLRICGRN